MLGRDRARWVRSPNDVAYRQVRENVTSMVGRNRELDRVPVPACPGWTVADLVAHLVEICWKVAKRSDRVLSPPFPTEGADPETLVQLWHTIGATVDQILLDYPGQRSAIMVMDGLTHELDIRQALGIGPPADHPGLCGTLDLLNIGFGRSVRRRGLPALRVVTSGGAWVAGAGEPVATVVAERYELYRSLAGRRTHAQIASLSWSAPPDRWLPAFEWGPFHPPAVTVEPAESGAAQRMAG